MGVRYENTNFKYYSHEEYVPSQSKRFSDLFPSLSISFPIGDSQIQVNYASDINRPLYYQLRMVFNMTIAILMSLEILICFLRKVVT